MSPKQGRYIQKCLINKVLPYDRGRNREPELLIPSWFTGQSLM